MFLNRLNKLLFMLVALFAVILVDSSNAFALECTSDDKYACAKCVYDGFDGDDASIEYIIKSDGTSNLKFSAKYYDAAGNVRDDKKITISTISAGTFVSSQNNTLECLPAIYVGLSDVDNGLSVSYTDNSDDLDRFNNGKKWYYSAEKSSVTYKPLLSDTALPVRKSCDFPVYVTETGNLDDNEKVKQRYAKVWTDGNELYTEFVVSTYYMSTSAEQQARKQSIIKQLLMYEDKDQCPCFGFTCKSNGGKGYICTLSTQSNMDWCYSTPTPQATSQFTCNYIGRFSNQKLTVLHYEDKYSVIYPGETDAVDIMKSKKGGNVFTDDTCDDIFYSAKNRTIKTVDADNKYASSYIKQFCNLSSDTEQYCYNGNCAIPNAKCGNSHTENMDGDCPDILKLPITFIKRVVFNTLQILVPIILILMGTIDITRSIMSNDEKAGYRIKDYISKFIRRVLTAIAFFFITTIVSMFIGMLANTDAGSKDGWKACWQNID